MSKKVYETSLSSREVKTLLGEELPTIIPEQDINTISDDFIEIHGIVVSGEIFDSIYTVKEVEDVDIKEVEEEDLSELAHMGLQLDGEVFDPEFDLLNQSNVGINQNAISVLNHELRHKQEMCDMYYKSYIEAMKERDLIETLINKLR